MTNVAGQRFRKHGEGDWRMLDESDTPAVQGGPLRELYERVVGHNLLGPMSDLFVDTPAVVPGKEPS